MDALQVALRHVRIIRQVRLNEGYQFKRKPATGGRFYRVEFDGLDATGIRRIEYRRIVCSSLREARARVSELRVASQRNWLEISDDVTVSAWLARWLESHCCDVTARTYQGYEQIARCHLTPALGHMKLSDLTPAIINGFYADQIAAGLCAQTVVHHHRCLSRALREAVAAGHLARSPITEAVRPPKTSRPERNFLDHGRVHGLLETIRGRSIELPAMLAVLCGLRAGEVCGLRWGDIDLSRGVMRVARSIEETRSRIVAKQPKSAKGLRTVPMPRELQEALTAHRACRASCSFSLITRDSYVVGNAVAEPLKPSTLSNRWRKFASTHGYRGVRFHDLRHTYASMILHEGAGIFVASRLLGHATAALTTDLYGHLLSDHAELAERISLSIHRSAQ